MISKANKETGIKLVCGKLLKVGLVKILSFKKRKEVLVSAETDTAVCILHN